MTQTGRTETEIQKNKNKEFTHNRETRAKRAFELYEGQKPQDELERLFSRITSKGKILAESSNRLGKLLGETALERGYCAFVFHHSESRAKRALSEIADRLEINVEGVKP